VSKVKPMIGGGQIWFCPGCNKPHHVNTTSVVRWDYNGDPDAPTFAPSILVTYDGRDAGHDDAPPAICHSFVRSGRIEFLGDCTHALAGQTVDMPEWPYAPGQYDGVDDGVMPNA